MNGPDFQYDGLTAFAPITNEATAKKKGLLSAADKAKLDTLAATVNRLAYGAAADLMNGAAIPATTWTVLVPAQSFSVGSASNWLAIEAKFAAAVVSAGVASLAARINLDSGASTIVFAGGTVPVAGATGSLGDSATIFLPPGTLTAGTHTLAIQVYSSGAATGYCRCATQPNLEFASLRVIEFT